MRSLFRSSGIVLAGLLVANGLTYVFYALSARTLGVSESGLLNSLLAVAQIAAFPGSIVAVAIARDVARALEMGEPSVVLGIEAFVGRTLLGAALILVLVALIGQSVFAAFFHVRDPLAFVCLAVVMALIACLPMQRALFQGSGSFAAYSGSLIAEGAVRALGATAIFATAPSVVFSLAAFGGGSLLAYGAGLPFVRPRTPKRGEGVVGWRPHADFLRAAPIGAITLMTFADVIAVRHAAPAVDAGLYASASLFGRAMMTVVSAIPTALLPAVARHNAAGRSSRRLVVGAVVATCFAVAVGIMAAWLAPEFIVRVLAGPAFLGARLLLLPYACAASCLALALVIATALVGTGRPTFWPALTLVAAAEIVALLVFGTSASLAVNIVIAGHAAALIVLVAAIVVSRFRRVSAAA